MMKTRLVKSIQKIVMLLVFMAGGLILMSSEGHAQAVKVEYGGKTRTYYKTIETVYVNGKKIDMSKRPIYLKSGCYVGSANVIFKNGLGIGYKAKKSPRQLTLKYGSKKLVLKNGKKKAKLNGKTKTMSAATWRVRYKDTGKIYWTVPIKSVCKRLGLYYKLQNGVIYINTEPEEDDTDTAISNSSSSSSKKIVIVLDAGHGGKDSGATANWDKPNSIEKNMTLKIVKAAKTYFDKDSHFKVYYTRVSDVYPSLNARYQLANSKKADLFISVHINSYASTSTGTETLYSASRNSKTEKNGITSKQLASCMQSYARAATGFTNRGLKNRPNLRVLKYTNMPACLIEYGFLSNKSEYKKMNSNLENYGRALYNGVVRLTKNKGLYK